MLALRCRYYGALSVFQNNKGVTVYEFIVAGGWLMVPIILCSIAVIAISVERFWSLSPTKIAPSNLIAQVWMWLKEDEFDADRMREVKNSSPLGYILSAGLTNSTDRDVMKESIEEAAGHVIHDLERYLNPLGTIAAVTPLLGLLGTTIGMIKVFSDIMIKGTGDAQVLAGGISEALITTASGLAVAIPALILHRYFQRRIDSIVIQLEQQSLKLVDALHSNRQVDIKEH
ncbi:Biopolymer transport protein ExbB [BD1-7 clade bacterium]|uniref:Biopolymer transport protein ExbB n=1 Tax=BD1-7 clade bacterium TaxID=2029982 RepID=A0A5S9P2S4_9GAMM|nr:Biopolymer transport protein ExbB [BD1-7 clade bacterium]CAA0094266.1 Biopolymer transport protein ExbB [BD1-7 clade bacterium]CAA0097426.1 Biopolymer transport protein ExbB [BD1-7 clade bacterium]CAA0122741.1 Biopolymer transport protein ExbB [BD1-7 clade bacterium]